MSRHVRESGQIPAMTLGFGNPSTGQGIRNPTKGGIQNPSSTQKDWNPVPGIRNPRPSWVLSHGAKSCSVNRGVGGTLITVHCRSPSMNVYCLAYFAPKKAGGFPGQ